MTRVDTRPRKTNAGRPPEKIAPGFLQWLRGRRCILESTGQCRGKVRACHVDYAGNKGMGSKVSDRFAFPACDGHHEEQHRIGWKSFERKYRIICLDLAAAFWRAWPGRPAWERKFQHEGEE